MTCYRDITIEFIKTGFTKKLTGANVRSGKVKDPYFPRVRGVGFVGEGRLTGGKAYFVWSAMLDRCYTNSPSIKNRGYTNCTVAPEWHNYQAFAAWYEKHHVDGWQLDKDILVEGNNVYSPTTCIFVDPKLNMLVNTYHDMTGATETNGRFQARIGINGKSVNLGCFDTILAASKAWAFRKAQELIKFAYLPTTPTQLIDPLLSRAVNLTRT